MICLENAPQTVHDAQMATPVPNKDVSPVVGASKLPCGFTLPGYIARLHGEAISALKQCDIQTDDYIKAWMMSECLRRMGWRVGVDGRECRLKGSLSGASLGVIFVLVLDDGTVLSEIGELGWDTIRRRAETEVQSFFKIKPAPGAALEFSWEFGAQGIVPHETQEKYTRFLSRHRRGEACIQSVIAVLESLQLQSQTPLPLTPERSVRL